MFGNSVTTTECKKVFLDTAPIIYFLDDHFVYGEKAALIFDQFLLLGSKMFTSVITAEEYLVYPMRDNNWEKVDVFFQFRDFYKIDLVPISLEIAKKAASIRAKYPSFKSMDALQLAVAVIMDGDLFLTNDKQLKQFNEIPCITIDEWIM